MPPKTRTKCRMPLAYDNPSDKCWFNALMVIISVFRPFLNILSSSNGNRPVSDFLKQIFENQPTCRNSGDVQIVDTAKVLRAFRQAIQEHLGQHDNQSSCNYKQLLHMLNNTGYHDPVEAWDLIHEIVRYEQHTPQEGRDIGVQVNAMLTCTRCKKTRIHDAKETQYMHEAIQLKALMKIKNPSVQTAIQHFFASEPNIQVRCCHGQQNVRHDKFFECVQGDSGIVFHGAFMPHTLQKYRHTKFNINDEIRLPLQGSSSGFQSSYELIGFTARIIDRGHHVAVILDEKGNAWTYDDENICKGLPKESWVPGLMLYELWDPKVKTAGVEFPQNVILECDTERLQSSASSDSNGSGKSTITPIQDCTTKRGRRSQLTDRYKPEQPKNNKKKKDCPVREDTQQLSQVSPTDPSTAVLTGSTTNQAQSLPSSGTNGSDQTSQTWSEKRVAQNKLEERFPADTWVWVKKKAEFLVARITKAITDKAMNIQWAHNSEFQQVNISRILRKLEVGEERIVFGLPHDRGRSLSLAKVEALLKSKGGQRNLISPTLTPEGDEQEGSYSGLVFTEATLNWDSSAFPWLLSSDSGFDPLELIGRSFPLPSTVPYDCFKANQEFPAHPSFGNCVREIGLIMQQLPAECRLYQLLFVWIHLLPILLLRSVETCSAKDLAKLIAGRCKLLMKGEWKDLYAKAVKDALKITERATRRQERPASVQTVQNKVKRANICIRRGNLSKGARILTGDGISKDPNAHTELREKHPQNVPVASFPHDYVPPPPPETNKNELAFLMSIPNMARVAGAFPAESHQDQWGWRPREYIALMLQDPDICDIVMEIFIQPRFEGKLPEMYGECYRGGQLLALSKAPKPGNRPITIGDAFRRLLDKALQPFSKKPLANMFEQSFNNVKQFASGSTDGAEKYIVTALLALREDPAPADAPNNLEEDPVAIMLLDSENAFNAIYRQVVFDMITRSYDRTYAQGRLTKHNTIVLPEAFSVHIPSIRGHYEGDGRLIYIDALRQPHEIVSRTGTQQGCVMGGKLFNIGTFSVVGTTMADHPEVYCPMFSDNLALVGRLSKIFKAAEDLRLSLREIGLRLQPADSAVYIPSYNKQEAAPQILTDLRVQYPEFSCMPWSKEGINLLGCPVGTDEFVQQRLEIICNRISLCSDQFSVVDDGLIHFQLHKLSVNAMLPYFLRTAIPALTVPYAQQVDALIWKALLDFSEVPLTDRCDTELQHIFQDARRQLAMRIGEGGFGVTPNECVTIPAFYSGVSKALRFAATCGFSPIKEYLGSPEFRDNPLCVAYIKARDDLIAWGAKEPEPQDTTTPSSAAQVNGDKAADGRKEKKPIILPTLETITAHTGQAELQFPDQKALTRLTQKAHQQWSADGLTAEGKTRTKHLSKQVIKAYGTEDETARYFQEVGGFTEDLELYNSPLAFLAHTESLEESFPKAVFSVVFTYHLGIPVPRCLQSRTTSRCEACNEQLDRFGHHRMTCKCTASYQAAHAQLAKACEDIMRKSGVPYTDKGVPSHLTANKKVGDALCTLSSGCRQLVLDYTVVHPRLGTSAAAGQWNQSALANAVKHKWNKHGSQYNVMGFAFAPCAMTTYGHVDANLLRLLYILAKKRAHLVHVHHRPFSSFDMLFGRFFAQGRARIGAAAAKGMALRALGVSAMGVSKVFLKHIAPARYRDQNLSAGPHMAAGHAQWRLILSL